ncbi:MAG: hypothetical protein PHV36_03710 [Elusimicrobiales bacterium]|nr:hypothetical protein [Elusimicrobiales bacterium]
MENIKGWAIDLKAVYGRLWADKRKFHLREDLWESADGDTAALLYGIREIGVSKEIGRLAVFRDKDKPVMALDLPRLECWYLYDSTAQFGDTGLLFVHRFSSGRKRLGVKVCALDLAAGRFAPIDSLPENFFRVRRAGGTEYGFARTSEAGQGETVIDLKALSWRGLPRSWWDRLIY